MYIVAERELGLHLGCAYKFLGTDFTTVQGASEACLAMPLQRNEAERAELPAQIEELQAAAGRLGGELAAAEEALEALDADCRGEREDVTRQQQALDPHLGSLPRCCWAPGGVPAGRAPAAADHELLQ